MPITAHRTDTDEDHRDDIMPDVGPDAEQRARMRKARAHGAKPDFKDEGFTAAVYEKFNGGKKPPAATGPEARIEDE